MGSVAVLSVVTGELPEPPYPQDTHVRGWKFQIDHERLFASDTWAIAPPDMRPWLLMLWHTAWVQRPAGSFVNDREIIAAKIGMDKRLFDAHADILLRGFERHADGRLYHQVIVEQVLQFQEHNRKERARVAAWRAERNAHVTRNKHVSTTPEPEPEPEPKKKAATAARRSSGEERRARCPYQEIYNLWQTMMPELPQPLGVEHWTAQRKNQIRARWHDQLPDMESWEDCFSRIRRSKFLMGRVSPTPGKKLFRCDLFWITKPENLLKLYEGKYHG